MRYSVMVLGRTYCSTLDVIRFLGAAGYRVYLAFIDDSAERFGIAACSKYVSDAKLLHKTEQETQISELIAFRETIAEDRVLLLGTDDYSAFLMDANRNRLQTKFVLPYAQGTKQGDTCRAMRKDVQSALAKAAGLNVPREWIIDLRTSAILPDDLVFPCYCKTVLSTQGTKFDQGRFNDAETLSAHLKKLRTDNPDREMLIQEFLDLDKEYLFNGVCVENDAFIPGIVVKYETTHAHSGLTVRAALKPLAEYPTFEAILPNIVGFLKSTRYIGLFDLEFHTTKDGRLFFNELNLRNGATSFGLHAAGVNPTEMLVPALMDGAYTKPSYENVRYGDIFIKEMKTIADFVLRERTLKETLSSFRKADVRLMHDATDPAPEHAFYRYWNKKVFNARLKQPIALRIKKLPPRKKG